LEAQLQAVGPALIILFAFSLVQLARAAQRLSGWMSFFGASLLTIVSLIEIKFYLGAWFPNRRSCPVCIRLRFISAVRHRYFIAARPFFLPAGIVLVQSQVLPRIFG
jgi:hypothetical protein